MPPPLEGAFKGLNFLGEIRLLALARHAVAVAVLSYASYSDLKTREVSDLVWIAACPIALALSLLGVFCGEDTVPALMVSIAFSAAVGLAFLRLGLVGGADALAFAFLGLSLPSYPFQPIIGDPLAFPFFATLCNAVVLSLACPVAVFTLNVGDVLRGRNPFKGVEVNDVGILTLMMFTVRRVGLERLISGLHYFPAEKAVERGEKVVRVPVHFVKAEADVSEMVGEIMKRAELYRDGVLASPTLPMVLFLAAGLALLPVGNIMLAAACQLLGC